MMEGDILGGDVSLSMMLAVGGAVLGGVFGLLRWFATRLLADIEKKMEEMTRELGRVDSDLKRLMLELPMVYQRRDDTIRELTAIHAKLDKLYELMVGGDGRK